MNGEHLVPPGEHPVRIRWLNAAEMNPSIQKPSPQHPQVTTVKTMKLTAPSVVNKTRTKPPNPNNTVKQTEQTAASSSIDTTIQSSKGIKELSAEDKLKIANLIKELARLGHEKEVVEHKLEQERRLFETQMKTVLVDYEKLMKDNQKLLQRYNQTKTILNEYEKKSQTAVRPTTNEFPNPQRSSTPILDQPVAETRAVSRQRAEMEPQISTRVTPAVLQEQFQLKQMMMEKQLELLQKQQQILETQLHHRTAETSNENLRSESSTKVNIATSPMRTEQQKSRVVERATSPVKQPTSNNHKQVEHVQKRPIQTQRVDVRHSDEDLLILSLNESLHEPKAKIDKKSRFNPSNAADSEEQNLLKDIFFIC